MINPFRREKLVSPLSPEAEKVFSNMIGLIDQGMPAPKPPTPRSTVGQAVNNCSNTRKANLAKADELTAEIARLTELLRQAHATVDAMDAALLALAGDPALTDEEREAAEQVMDKKMEDAVDTIDFGELREMRGAVNTAGTPPLTMVLT